MPWGRIDDTFHSHPKVLGIPRDHRLAAVGLYWMAISWSNAHTTDGRVSAMAVAALGGTDEQARALVKVRLWHRRGRGYEIHDFAEYSRTREQIVTERSELRRAPVVAREVKARDGDLCRYCGVRVNWLDRRGPRGGTYDHVVPLLADGPDTLENLVVSCRSCNSRKGSRTPSEAGMSLMQVRSRSDQVRSRSDLEKTSSRSRSDLEKIQVIQEPVPSHTPTREETPPPPTSGGRRKDRTNPRAAGTSPRQEGTNPRSDGTSIRAEREAQKRGPTKLGDLFAQVLADKASASAEPLPATADAPADAPGESWFEPSPKAGDTGP